MEGRTTISGDDDERGPERTCIVTRRKGAPETMIRFVAGPDDSVVPDVRRKLPGRGVWVSATATTVGEAVRKNAFSRGLKRAVRADATLADEVGSLLTRDALQSLAMANKAGVVLMGFGKVEAAIGSGAVVVVLHAVEAGEDGVRKLAAASRRHAPEGGGPLSIKLFGIGELELALGRTNVIHAALAVGPASQAFLTRCRRLIMYRSLATLDSSAGVS